MKLGVIGAGYIGRAIGRLAVARGHDVMLANSRGPKTLTSTMISVGCKIGTTEQAAAFGDLLLLAIPFANYGDVAPAPFAGKIVMDANNYYPQRDGQIAALDLHATTTSELIAGHFAGAKIVKAFNAILERDIEKDARTRAAPDRRALPIAGDDASAKRIVDEFIDGLGFDVVDAGLLAQGWRFERARPVYCVPLSAVALAAALANAGTSVAEGSWRT